MDSEVFFRHHGVIENPFQAEEARDDPVFDRLGDHGNPHPEFDKILGRPERPAAAVVFGEKGSGKTALRLMLQRRLTQYNDKQPNQKNLILRYDDFNPILDRFCSNSGLSSSKADKALSKFTLNDHQDAILMLAVTKLVDVLLQADAEKSPLKKTLKKLPRDKRVSLAQLVSLYDQDPQHAGELRQKRMMKLLHLRWWRWEQPGLWTGLVLLLLDVIPWFWIWWKWQELSIFDKLGYSSVGVLLAILGLLLLVLGSIRAVQNFSLARKMLKQLRVVHHHRSKTKLAMSYFKSSDFQGLPVPSDEDPDARYTLMRRLQGILEPLGYSGIVVLMDRVDEPVMINGQAGLMKSFVWSLFNNKFLQQEGLGMKMLLPIELRYMLHREDPEFFQSARLDKQQLIDRLDWSGAMLYDICSRRLQVCSNRQGAEDSPITLRDLFEEDVQRQELVDALDQMHQPRDAFKFIYKVIMEHCSRVTEDQNAYHIPRLTLETVRKAQSQRIQEFQRGLSPS